MISNQSKLYHRAYSNQAEFLKKSVLEALIIYIKQPTMSIHSCKTYVEGQIMIDIPHAFLSIVEKKLEILNSDRTALV